MKKLSLFVITLTTISFCAEAVQQGASSFGFAEAQGLRQTMEDAHYIEIKDNFAFFGLYDGHGGRDVADFAAGELHHHVKSSDIKDMNDLVMQLHNAFITTHQYLDTAHVNMWTQGCTALVACMYNNHLFIANAGDSRAVLCSAGIAIPLSDDHKPDRLSERERIEALGGFVITWGVPRVNGQLAVSRALGDKALNPFVIPDPEITQRQLTGDDEFLIIACDGVWDVIDNQTAVDIVKNALISNNNNFEKAAEVLRDQALACGSTDNISVIIINLKKYCCGVKYE